MSRQSLKIEKKIIPEYFDAVASGAKRFELRLNDFSVAAGDTLYLREWDPKKGEYTGRALGKRVSYVGKFMLDDLFWPKVEIERRGLLVLSFE